MDLQTPDGKFPEVVDIGSVDEEERNIRRAITLEENVQKTRYKLVVRIKARDPQNEVAKKALRDAGSLFSPKVDQWMAVSVSE